MGNYFCANIQEFFSAHSLLVIFAEGFRGGKIFFFFCFYPAWRSSKNHLSAHTVAHDPAAAAVGSKFWNSPYEWKRNTIGLVRKGRAVSLASLKSHNSHLQRSGLAFLFVVDLGEGGKRVGTFSNVGGLFSSKREFACCQPECAAICSYLCMRRWVYFWKAKLIETICC